MICPKCGHEVADDAKFCNKCGASMAEVPAADGLPTCQKCGYHFEAPAKFCIKCGAPVESAPAEPAKTAAPPKAAAGSAPKQPQPKPYSYGGAQPNGMITSILGKLLPADILLAIAAVMDVTFLIICIITGIISFVRLGQLMGSYGAPGGFIATSIIKYIMIIVVWALLAASAAIDAFLTIDVFKFSQRVKRTPTGVVSFFKKGSGFFAIAVFANGALIIAALIDLIINAIISGYTWGLAGIHGGSIALCVFMMISGGIGLAGAILLYKMRNYVSANANSIAQMERSAPKY